MRFDPKGKVTIRNVGLGNLLDQLREQGDEADEFDITAHPSDDIAAISRIGNDLFGQHVGQPITDTDKALAGFVRENRSIDRHRARQPRVSHRRS